ncbi:disintegrin and metalloproteinase domain-containing protein 9-like [Heteronotia binoei]|uniref:disintegrin and metalloproteinase domain-containing protein 9-like n=1 Tax=Heteronotia binoei TaxID=13085 RepID=UPI00292ED246|nr:disintegrin and metalloproteinase domain-containing protein 9-like [Heteronotia binoei]
MGPAVGPLTGRRSGGVEGGLAGSEALLLGSLLLLLLGPGSVKSSNYVYTEVIVPRQLKTKENFQEADVSYIIKAEGNYHIIHLKHITFIVPNIPVYSFNMKGDRIADYPYIEDDCYYNGFVEDIADSRVVLSICSGLRGHMQIEGLNYEIKPIENSATFQHLIYRRAQEDHEPCGGILEDGGTWTSDLAQMAADSDSYPDSSDREGENLGSGSSVRYLEFYSIMDRSKALSRNENETQLLQNMLIVMADVHSIYFEIGLHVYLVGLELWTERDPILIGNTLLETLKEFQNYASYSLLQSINFDHASLITTRGHHLGITSGEHYCQHSYPSVSVIRSVGSLQSDADQTAHQLGHSFGFFHDDQGRHCDCSCPQTPGFCIMHADYSTGVCRRLSNCSKQTYYDLVRKPGKECLLNKPSKVFETMVCGNGILDGGEECDCGQDEECRINGCCQANCKFSPDADCLNGLCCEKCKYLPEGSTCRPAATECDLAEYCNGATPDCPPDTYKQDGTPCGHSASCYTGQCFNLQHHCTVLFGNDAKLAPLSCFEEVNTRGDRSGNCGEEGSKFKKCQKQDVLCGRLQCTDIGRIPKLPTGQGVLQTPAGKILCWGTEFHLNLDGYDLGAVRDGTSCGNGKICMNRSCVSLEVLNYDCDLNRCNNRGVCNNQKNCHCKFGWAPPFCEGKGYGGSVDSGPPPVYSSNFALTIAVSALVGVILFAFLAIAVLKRDELKAWLAQSYTKRESPQPELTAEPEDTPNPAPEPEVLPEPQHTPPIKRKPSQRALPEKCASQLEGRPQLPEPRPQPQYPQQPEPRPQPQNPPEPRPQPQYPRQPEPRPQPRNPPEPKPQPQYPRQPEPRPQPRNLPEPRPQPQYPRQQEPRPQPQCSPEPKPKPQYPRQPEARPQPRNPPGPKPQPQHPRQPEPRAQSQHLQEPRPQSQYPLRPETKPKPQYPPQREPRPHSEQTKMRKPSKKLSRSSS